MVIIIGIIALGLVELLAFQIQKLRIFKMIGSSSWRKITARTTVLLCITLSLSLVLLLFGITDINVLGIFALLCFLYFILLFI